MAVLDAIRPWLGWVTNGVERVGYSLLVLYQALAATSHGRLSYRPVSPIALGTGAVIVASGMLVGVILVLASALGPGAARAVFTPLAAAPK